MRGMFIKLFKSNSDISEFLDRSAHLKNPQARRSAIKIAVIDDEPFAPQTNLQSYGYNIKPIGDLKNLKEVAEYHIVLCDIMGVGRHFDSNLQGASLTQLPQFLLFRHKKTAEILGFVRFM
jgi:hypothetical protein